MFLGQSLEQTTIALGSRRCLVSRKQPLRLGFNMAFHFNPGAKLGTYRIFKLRCIPAGFNQRHKTIHFQIETHRQSSFDFLNGEW